MGNSIEAQVIDSRHLQLKQPIQLPPGSTVMITIEPAGGEFDSRGWYSLSAQGLELSYGEDEPEYSANMIKEPNSEYKP